MIKRLLIAVLCLTITNSIAAIEVVDVELQLLIDISGSVDSQEYDLQMQGYQAAFESDTVSNAIINGHLGKIAVQMIMWSGRNQQQVMIDWTLIDSVEASNNFAATIATLARPFAGMTAIGSAIAFSYPQFDSNDFQGTTQVIDISGDGTRNSGVANDLARDAALAAGVDTINGIVITQDSRVVDQYADSVVGGDTPFLLAPATFTDFQLAIENKIAAEIAGTTPPNAVPISEPAHVSVLALSLLVMFRRKFVK